MKKADVARHKYGKNVGDAADEVSGIVKDSSQIVKNVTDLGVKPMARTVVGNAAIDVMSDDQERKKNQEAREQNYAVDPTVRTVAYMAAAQMNPNENNDNNKKYNV